MSDDAPAVPPASTTNRTWVSRSANERAVDAAEQVNSLGRRAGWGIWWERVWPRLAIGLVIAAVFTAAAWFGLFMNAPVWVRIAAVAVAGLGIVAAIAAAALTPRPSWRDALSRLDRDSSLPHRPATAITDGLANNPDDPVTRALWEAHRARVLEQAAQLKVAPPRPRLPDLDPKALRYAAVLALVAAFFVAGAERSVRLMSAFDWSGPRPEPVAFRIDGWIDPPAYTQFPPVLLDLKASATTPGTQVVKVPARSTLVVRASDADGVAVSPSGGIEAAADPKDETQAPQPGQQAQTTPAPAARPAAAPASAGGPAAKPAEAKGFEQRWTVKGDGTVTIRRGTQTLATLQVTAIPDTAPTIQPTGEPTADTAGTLSLTYEVKDDYGVTAAEARVGRMVRNGKTVEGRRPPLVPAPSIPLMLPGGDNREGEARTTTDLSAHPWAGARVEVTLSARDELGQEGLSVPFLVTLPQRPFSKPLAKALVEQRRDLILDPASRPRIMSALQALLIAPDQFTPDTAVYLGLRVATTRLRTARTDQDLIAVADYLWEMALQIEEGDLSDAEKQLRAAQENLKQAMERGATDQELQRLMQELRQAMDKYLREFAERMMREQRDNPQQADRMDRNMRTITPRDLQSMMDHMEKFARNGQMAEAQRMLEQLRQMMENLRTARPSNRGQQNQAQRDMDQAMDDLDQMARDQQQLRDKTFREGQRQRDRMRQGNRDQNMGQQGQRGQRGQQGQQGQRGQRGQQGQQGQQGQGEDGEMGQGDGDGEQEGMEGLGQRQQSLRRQLEDLKRKMQQYGMNGEQGLDDAEEAMKQAEGAMGRGDDGQAVEQQGRALEGLRRGAQGLAQQMQQGDGTEQADGDPNGPGRPGNRRAQASEPNDDPLGRPTPTTDPGDRSKFRRGGKGGTLEQRAREVMEELRRRMGDPTRPQEELDYLQRLMPVN